MIATTDHTRTLPEWGCSQVPGRALRLPRLAQLREAKYLSQYELADRAKVARSTIARIEGGDPARYATIRALAAALEVTPDELTREA